MPKEMTVGQFEQTALGGRIFTVEFVKRTDGQLRRMNCRMGVRKGTDPANAPYDPAAHHLLPVYDMEKQGFRSVNLDDLVALHIDGLQFVWSRVRGRFVEAQPQPPPHR